MQIPGRQPGPVEPDLEGSHGKAAGGKTTSESPWLQHIHLPASPDDLSISTFWAVTQSGWVLYSTVSVSYSTTPGSLGAKVIEV